MRKDTLTNVTQAPGLKTIVASILTLLWLGGIARFNHLAMQAVGLDLQTTLSTLSFLDTLFYGGLAYATILYVTLLISCIVTYPK